jgi:hypothetical protein
MLSDLVTQFHRIKYGYLQAGVYGLYFHKRMDIKESPFSPYHGSTNSQRAEAIIRRR